MKIKKTKRANLENKRSIFLQLGLVIVLSMVLAAFEWSSELNKNEFVQLKDFDDNTPADIINTFPEKPKPEKPKPKIQYPLDILITPDDIEIDDVLEFHSEADESMAIPIKYIEDKEKEDNAVVPFIAIEDKPEFKNGEKGLLLYLAESIKYPTLAVESNIQGTVHIAFVIDEKGRVTNVALLRGVHPLLDQEALRVVKNMPDWKPGKQRGKPVCVSYNVPISFRLQ